jgi:hypothetical protein
MKDFKDYLIEEEEKQIELELKEDVPQTVANILGFATGGIAIAFGASLLTLGGLTAIKGLKFLWQKIKKTAKDILKPKEIITKAKTDPQVKKIKEEIKETKKKFEDELKHVYIAIGQKDFDTASEEYNNLSSTFQNNPDVIKSIVAEITRVIEQPPIYIQSPGNQTYQAIKKVLNIRIARAAAMATEMAIKSSSTEGLAGD